MKKIIILMILFGIFLTGCAKQELTTYAINEQEEPIKEFTMIAKWYVFEPSTITVNKGDKVKLTVTSIDSAHGFSLPEFGINVALPSKKSVTIEFVANKTGTFTFYCSVPCGSGHGDMKGQLIVK